VLFAVLAPVARLLGYSGSYPEYGRSGFVEVEPFKAPGWRAWWVELVEAGAPPFDERVET
jgi:hypothetical protein